LVSRPYGNSTKRHVFGVEGQCSLSVVARKIFLAHEFAGGDWKAGGNKEAGAPPRPAFRRSIRNLRSEI